MSNPAADSILVSIDPCDPRLLQLDLKAIVASHPLEASCLIERGRLRWMGAPYIVYQRT